MTIGDPCVARVESDQVRCAECRMVWDRNDPDPPVCGCAVPVEAPPLAPGHIELTGNRYVPSRPEWRAPLVERERLPFASGQPYLHKQYD